MSDELEAVKRVLEAFNRSRWREIDVRSGHLRVHLSAVPLAEDRPLVSAAPGDLIDKIEDPETPNTDVATSRRAEVPPKAQMVFASSPGIFWRAPEPGAPPFTDVGAMVDVSSTICIIEIMKLMNHVKAGIAGEVVAIFVGDGEPVERGDELMAVLPGQETST